MDRLLNYLPIFRWVVGAACAGLTLLVTSQVCGDRTAADMSAAEPVTLPIPTENRAAQALMPTFVHSAARRRPAHHGDASRAGGKPDCWPRRRSRCCGTAAYPRPR
ncbi:MAG: hypothetical protein R2873_23910 [Caldilineaceae bacterium]